MIKFNDSFIKACKMQETDRIPVWFLRQAGRYQKEYMAIKEKYTLVEICKNPEVTAEVTMLPVNQFDVDTAIIFSDILIPLEPMGIEFDYIKGYGPKIFNPIRSVQDVENLKPIFPEKDLWYTGEAHKILASKLNIPCVGFVGAPFTLASYMIEGGPSKNYAIMKEFMYRETATWHKLMDKLAIEMAVYCNYQVDCGAQVLQVFDSWVGALSREDYTTYVFPHMKKMMSLIRNHTDAPIINFGVGCYHFLDLQVETGTDVLGIDWKQDIFHTWEHKLNHKVAVQGNLDPTLLFAEWSLVEKRARAILEQVNRPGFIFNLGHGILPGTPVDNVKRLAELVHEYSPVGA
jgi:uroporphyrinogen decarboxylase